MSLTSKIYTSQILKSRNFNKSSAINAAILYLNLASDDGVANILTNHNGKKSTYEYDCNCNIRTITIMIIIIIIIIIMIIRKDNMKK